MADKYRPVHTKLWADAKFNSLSDDGRMVWLMLLTAPSPSPIPGVIIGGEAMLAELMGWSIERFRQGFREPLANGFAMASDTRLVWLKNAIRHQPPINMNVAKYWATGWSEIPECALKHELWIAIKSACLKWWGTLAAWFPEPLANGYPKPSPKQEQEQEQEQYGEGREQQPPAAPPKRQSRRPARAEAPLPIDFAPTEHHRVLANERGLDLAHQVEKFKSNAEAKGLLYKNWNAALNTWLLGSWPDRRPNGRGDEQQTLTVNLENYQ